MNDSMTTRRRFLVAAIAFSGVTAGAIGPASLRFGSAWAQSGSIDSLARIARHLLPHDGLSDDEYAQVLNDTLLATADDASIRSLEVLLNEQQSTDFMSIDEAAQLDAMRAVQNDAAFTVVLAAIKTGFYGHPSVWKIINYEGPSYQDGGYLNRGAGVIDWLPETD